MKKTMKAAAVLCALFACLVLVGCGGKVRLDRAVTLDGLSMSVPSQWEERDDRRYTGRTSADFMGGAMYTDQQGDDGDGISVDTRGGTYNTGTLESWLANELKFATSDPVNGYGYRADKIGETVIDGAKVVKYDISYKQMLNGSEHLFDYHHAYITRSNATYVITVWGDSVSLDDVLSTVHIG